MIYLANTHALFWYIKGDPRLSTAAKYVFEKAERGEISIIIPTISLLELLFICKKKNTVGEFREMLKTIHNSINYVIHDLDFYVVLACIDLDNITEIHDRVITATATMTGAKIITNDRNITESGYADVLW